MALFFDSAWFDGRLAAVHLSRADLARALGLDDAEIADVWKDQRELSARDVAVMAALLAESAEEVAAHAGISTPVPPESASGGATLADIERRVARVEAALARIEALLARGER